MPAGIKILTVLNGVSGNGLGKGTPGAFGACGATQATRYQDHSWDIFNTGYEGISPGGLRPPPGPPRPQKSGTTAKAVGSSSFPAEDPGGGVVELLPCTGAGGGLSNYTLHIGGG